MREKNKNWNNTLLYFTPAISRIVITRMKQFINYLYMNIRVFKYTFARSI